MFHQRTLLAFLAIIVIFSCAASSELNKASNDALLAKDLLALVKNILQGKDLGQSYSSVDMEAYLIDGKHFESLPGVLHGEAGNCKLTEGSESKTMFEQLTVTDDRSAAYMVIKTNTPRLGERFHSVIFFADAEHHWKIRSWHISH